ncbi:MAG: ATP-binding cassette domain-containing protein [Bdellovibrionaceae bacterium]|nr:ATP-binding cassette domain-containing protein [Pseudobdellovibrionaceae bacterium]
MSLLQINGASKAYAHKVLFRDAGFAVGEGEHIGLIGPNGAGKTTLLKVLMGLEELDAGEVIRSRSLRLGYLEQEADWDTEETIEACLLRQCSMPLWDLKKHGRELGLFEEHFSRPLKSFSGGYRMRVKLLSLIGKEANLLLLDEPTNFLDLETVLVVERFLQGYDGAFLLISHDREFLRRVTDHTVEVESGDITKYPGNIDDYFEQKALLREQLEKAAAGQAAKREQVMDFVRRFGAKATKARQAQSRLKSLDKMERIELKDVPVRARIPIPAPIRTGKEVLRTEGLDCGYGAEPVLRDVRLVLNRGEHAGIVGLNGAGKSTLLKTLAEALPAQKGSLQWGMNVSRALFSQHSAEQLNAQDSVFEALSNAAHPDVTRQEVLNLAGGLLFGGDNIEKKIRVLSGGEKARVALGQVLLSKSSLLLLDEPTNHLDFDTVEALTHALASFDGTLVVVSHDRGFVRRVSSRILEVNHGQVTLFPGSYDDYVWSLQKGVLAGRDPAAPGRPGNPAPPPAASRGSAAAAVRPSGEEAAAGPSAADLRQRLKEHDAEARKLEKSLPGLEKKLAEKTAQRDELNERLTKTPAAEMGAVLKDFQEVSHRVEQLEDELLTMMERLEWLQQERARLRP